MEFEFYYWEQTEYLPTHKKLTIDKALKKSIYTNYQKQMINKSYNFIYPYCIIKYIKDVDIAQRLLSLDLDFKKFINPNSLGYFLQYLTKYFSYIQIENLFISYQEREMFWLIDTIDTFAKYDFDTRESFPKIPCRYNILHDDIISYFEFGVIKSLFVKQTVKQGR